MKKLFLAMMAVATIAMVGCKPANNDEPTPGPKPSGDKPVVEATADAVTIVWNCLDANGKAWAPKIDNQLVFAGNYNDYNTNAADMVKFEKIEGFDGWWKAVITPYSVKEGTEHKDGFFCGKPCALYMDGTFPSSWDHQWIGIEDHPCEIVEGDATLEVEYDVESKLVVPAAGGVVYVRSYGFKTDPNVEPETYKVTFNLTTIDLGSDVVYLAGKMQGWAADATPLTKVDATHWTVTLENVVMGDEYKYLVNGDWAFNELGAEDEKNPGTYVAAGNRKVDDVEMNDEVLVWKGINGEEAPKAEE